ncbi:DUF512 domain-containing protein [bacterium]|nr:MAG: DUF512 domain-containing protein [bacterium]
MVYIDSISDDSPASHAGLCAGDSLVSADGHILHDALDVQFYIEGVERVEIAYRRAGFEYKVILENRTLEPTGINPHPIGLRRCKNNCIFCFIDQQPKGLRKSLYIKDEDIRHSFLYGNYITLTDTPEWEFARIIEQRMGPLYVSVHATDDEIRQKLLGREKIPPIMARLKRLTEAGIGIHSQIVIVPGYNDGAVLERTVSEIYSLGENALSCAVVPVGLTRYREGLPHIDPVSPELARDILSFCDRLRKSFDRPEFLQAADELFLLAGREIPETDYYGDYPQLDNGVGLVRSTIDDAIGCAAFPESSNKNRTEFLVDIVTGTRAAHVLEKYFPKNLGLPGVTRRIIALENLFWGSQVTAANLLTGKEITDAVYDSHADIIFLPPKVLNADNLFLDGISLDDLKEHVGGRLISGPAYLSEIQEVICAG